MHRRTRYLVTAAVATALLVPASAAGAETTTRLGGETNVQVAIAFSQATFADGSAPTVLLARDDDFADTLTSSSAQGVLNAPLLLTNREVLSPETMLELQRLDPEVVGIMGGPEAVTPAVEAALTGMGVTVERYAGASRVETAIEVARRFFPTATAAVVARAFAPEGGDPTQAFADPIAAGAYSAATNTPVLLTASEDLSPATASYITGSTIEAAMIAGGPLAVSEAVQTDLAAIDVSDLGTSEEGGDPVPFQVTRIAGETRGGTAVALAADLGYGDASAAPRVILLESFAPDAWAAGLSVGAQAANGAAVVLSYGAELFGETTAFLDPAAGSTPLLCGPWVDPGACDAAAALMDNDA